MGVESTSREPAEVRRGRVLELARSRGFVRPGDIAEAFGVSDETGRRDLASLSAAGHLERVHGGAVFPEGVLSTEPDRGLRRGSSVARKREIAAIAGVLVGDDDTVFFDVGTTLEAAAKSLPTGFRGTVVTNNLPVAMAVGGRAGVEIHVVGGRMRPGEFTTYGPDALHYLSSFRARVAFIGCGAVHPEHGVSDYAAEDVPLKRAMIAQSEQAYVLATSEKLGRTATRVVCPLADVTGVVTDSDASGEQLRVMNAAGVDVMASGS